MIRQLPDWIRVSPSSLFRFPLTFSQFQPLGLQLRVSPSLIASHWSDLREDEVTSYDMENVNYGMRWRDEEWRECPGTGTTPARLLTFDHDYSRDHWECAVLGPGDCQHPSPVTRPSWPSCNKWSHTRDQNIPINRSPSLSITSIIDNSVVSMSWPKPVLSPIRCPPLSPSRGMRPLKSLKTRFLTGILSKYLLIQFPHSLWTLAAADNFIRQLKFYRGNVIALRVSEMISDWKCWLHFSSSSVWQISAWHRDIMTPVSRLRLVSSPWLLLTMALLSTGWSSQGSSRHMLTTRWNGLQTVTTNQWKHIL